MQVKCPVLKFISFPFHSWVNIKAELWSSLFWNIVKKSFPMYLSWKWWYCALVFICFVLPIKLITVTLLVLPWVAGYLHKSIWNHRRPMKVITEGWMRNHIDCFYRIGFVVPFYMCEGGESVFICYGRNICAEKFKSAIYLVYTSNASSLQQ